MNFQAKSTLAMFCILSLVYGGYFAVMLPLARRTPLDQIVYQPVMIIVTIPLIVLAAVVHAGIAIWSPREAGMSDERDELITLRGERIGGLVLGVGTFCGLVLAMFGGHRFWIAHTLLGGLVLAELATAATMLVLYRRGS